MTHLRERWEGVCLSGKYTLEQWLGGNDNAAFFQTTLAPDGSRAVVKLAPEAVVEGAGPLDLWHRTRQLRHPNLVELLDCGRADHGGETVLYAVFESPDETLADAIGRSPLSPQESREVLDAVLDALRYLHAQGLVLGALDADHIVAVGDRIKLSTGAVRDAETSSAYREDVRLLGELWRQTLMSASPKSSEIAAHAADPDPQARWTLAEIGAALDYVPVISEPPVCEPPVVPNDAPGPPPSYRRAARYRFPTKWIFAGAAAVVLLIFGLNRPRLSSVAGQSRVVSVSPPAATPAPEPKPSPVGGRENWRVIAFTYRTRDAAAKKVEQLNQNHPGLNAAVFSPKDRRDYYLVSLGGRMTHEEAVQLQHSARGKGLPRDLYVQNYSE
jgi:hypothetical protein